MNNLEETKKETLRAATKYYKEERAKIEKAIFDNQSNLDKTIITIASGAVFLTITFFDQIVSINNCLSPIFLKISWVFLVLTICTAMTSYIIALKGCNINLAKTDNWYKDAVEKIEKGERPNLLNFKNGFFTTANILDIATYISFMLGVFFSLIFALISF